MYYLYIFCVSNAAKIGITSDVERRRKEIQAHNPNKIHVACTFTFPDQESAFKVEQSLHKYYADRHIHYEWYRVDPIQVVSLVDMIRVFHAATDIDVKVTARTKEQIQIQYNDYKSGAAVRVREYLKLNPEDANMNVRELADKIGVGKSTVSAVRADMKKRGEL